jgi:ribosome-associated translation inhibitor RaiA
MTFPIQLAFHRMDRSDALETHIRERAGKLGKFHPGLTHVHVTVTQETRHGNKGRLFNVRLDLHVKGHSMAITQQGDEDAFVAARDAFDAATRLLGSEIDTTRGFVKQHPD